MRSRNVHNTSSIRFGGSVARLAWWSGGTLRQYRSNAAAPLVKELDLNMPGIAWDLLPMEKYRAHNWHCFGHLNREPYAALYTTLGCPYKCSFCCIQAPFKAGEKELGLKDTVNSYRFWSPQRVIEEIDLLVNEHGVRNIKFADEMFVLNVRHVSAICDLIIERGYDLNIWAYARVDTVKDGMLDKLKRAGFNWLAFGIEAASDRVLSDVDKRYEVEQVYDTIGRVKAAGINIISIFHPSLPSLSVLAPQHVIFKKFPSCPQLSRAVLCSHACCIQLLLSVGVCVW